MRIEEKNLADFFRCPFDIYGKDCLYVSPLKSDLERFLDPRRNPLFRLENDRTFFTASRGDKIVGRIVAHLHRSSNELYRLSRSYFGYFDCIDDQDIANALLKAAEDWGRRQSCNEIAGNFNLTAMQQIGVMTDGFENAPYLDQTYNPPHMVRLLERAGYERFFPMTTFELDLEENRHSNILSEKAGTLRSDRQLTFKNVNKREFRQLMADACHVLNRGFSKNPMFVPLSTEEFWFQAKEMMWIMDPRISILAYRDGQPIAVVVCIPDLNPLLRAIDSRFSITAPWHYLRYRLNRERAVIIYYSVVPEEHGKGLNSLMLHEVATRLLASGYRSMGITWIADVNKPSLRQMEKIGARQLHRLHLFKKPL